MDCRCEPRLETLGIRTVQEAEDAIAILRGLVQATMCSHGDCIFCEADHDFVGLEPIEKHLLQCPFARLFRWLESRDLLPAWRTADSSAGTEIVQEDTPGPRQGHALRQGTHQIISLCGAFPAGSALMRDPVLQGRLETQREFCQPPSLTKSLMLAFTPVGPCGVCGEVACRQPRPDVFGILRKEPAAPFSGPHRGTRGTRRTRPDQSCARRPRSAIRGCGPSPSAARAAARSDPPACATSEASFGGPHKRP